MRRAANGTMGSVLSMTLPPSMVADIDRLARLCGVNRSEFIRTAIAEKAASMGFEMSSAGVAKGTGAKRSDARAG